MVSGINLWPAVFVGKPVLLREFIPLGRVDSFPVWIRALIFDLLYRLIVFVFLRTQPGKVKSVSCDVMMYELHDALKINEIVIYAFVLHML